MPLAEERTPTEQRIEVEHVVVSLAKELGLDTDYRDLPGVTRSREEEAACAAAAGTALPGADGPGELGWLVTTATSAAISPAATLTRSRGRRR